LCLSIFKSKYAFEQDVARCWQSCVKTQGLAAGMCQPVDPDAHPEFLIGGWKGKRGS
jgi:hypothetical protein